MLLKIRVTGHRSHQFKKHMIAERAGWLTAQYFAQDTKQTGVLRSQTLPRYHITVEREIHSPQFIFTSFSGCLVMSPSQSFTQQAHYLSLSRSPAAPTHSVTCKSPHDYLAHHHAQEIGTHYFSFSFSPSLSLCSPSCPFISHLICRFLCLSAQLGDRALHYDMRPAS